MRGVDVMFTNILRTNVDNIDVIIKALKVHENIRQLLNYSCDKRLPSTISQLKSISPSHVEWKRLDHCTAVVRLYSIYELFVYNILEIWLEKLPQLFDKYSDLPEPVRNAYRSGIGGILIRLGGTQHQGISEQDAIEGMYNGLIGRNDYKLFIEAFKHSPNLWCDELDNLLTRIGFEKSIKLFDNDKQMRKLLGGTSTVKSEIDKLVRYRNEAAHGSFENILGLNEIEKIADFIKKFMLSLSDMVENNITWRLYIQKKASLLGEVIKEYRDMVIGVECRGSVSLTEGKTILIVNGENNHQAAKIDSIEIEKKNIHTITTEPSQKIGLKLTRKAKKGSFVYIINGIV